MTRHLSIRILTLALAAVTLVAGAAAAGAPANPVTPLARGVTLLGLRTWSAPTNTRFVLDFSSAIVPVAPDSGRTPRLAVSIPGENVERSPRVPSMLRVADGAVDSVLIDAGPEGARLTFVFTENTSFRVFTLPAGDDKPFRLVVDVTKPSGGRAQDDQIARIVASKRGDRARIITIDPGHGGEDTGARGPRGVLEKSVNLGVAKALADALNDIPGIQAALTRDGDYFIPLRDRYRIAERMKADVFISIHANSSKRRGSGSGTEVYFLSMRGASDQATQDLADVENAADLVGGVSSQADDDLVNILYDVKRSSALHQSQLLAETLLGHLGAVRKLEQLGVKQAGFAVLKSVEFPSVLVETAFINNPTEAKLLRDPEFQKQIGRQLAEGVRAFLERSGVGLGSEPRTTGGSAASSGAEN